ncbi:mercury transporter MerT [Methylobacterium indicum]|uniref:mercury transporter MerT n=1 Tax=Methylobacterium indicum TaxID=1775910 RepID=UPI000B2C1B8D|nr:mercury transporter MerT [Methylobacterium indicum]
MALDQAQPTEILDHGSAAVGAGSLAALGAVTGLGALAASSCCVLPIVLGGLGASAGVFTVLGLLVPLRVPLMTASVLAVIVGWFLYARRRPAACRPDGSCTANRRSPAVLALLSLATVLIAAAAAGGYFEPALIKLLRSVR